MLGQLAVPSAPGAATASLCAVGRALPRVAAVACEGSAGSQPRGLASLAMRPDVSIAAGLALLLLLVCNRLVTDELLNSQSRADLIATVAPAVLLLDALTRVDISPKEADAVPQVRPSVRALVTGSGDSRHHSP